MSEGDATRPRIGAVPATQSATEKLEALGVRGILWQLARDGQILDVRCEMPQATASEVEGISIRSRLVPIGRRRRTTTRD